MGRSAFEALGISHEKSGEMIDVFSQHDKVSMVEVADAHQIGVPFHENKTFIARLKKYLEEKNPQLQAEMKRIQDKNHD
jgi:CPA2 family monovalent cation:H+ antiporter-2